MVGLLKTLVGLETPTDQKPAVDKAVDFLAEQFSIQEASSIKRIMRDDIGDFLLAKWNEDAPGQPILFLVHIDTVWPLGTLGKRPIRQDDEGRLYGPGALDMKGGIVIMLEAIRGLRVLDRMPDRPIWVLVNSDEETGSVQSRAIIEDTARQCGLVLVMEPPLPGGIIKTARKGGCKFDIRATGRSSHAGIEPEKGINAVIELARQAAILDDMTDFEQGTSVSVTTIKGGFASNVIPDRAQMTVDVRAVTIAEYDRVRNAIEGLQPITPGIELEVERVGERRPMERNERMIADFQQLSSIAGELGMTLEEGSAGGMSDGNFTASMGISTLDGLGAEGDGPHATNEHIIVSSLPRRAALIANVLTSWEF